MTKRIVPMPVSALIAVVGVCVLALFQTVRFVTGITLDVAPKYPIAQIIALALSLSLGLAPAAVACVGFFRGRRWVPVVFTAASAWGAILLSSTGPVVPWGALGVAVASVGGIWTGSARRFLRDARDITNSGLR